MYNRISPRRKTCPRCALLVCCLPLCRSLIARWQQTPSAFYAKQFGGHTLHTALPTVKDPHGKACTVSGAQGMLCAGYPPLRSSTLCVAAPCPAAINFAPCRGVQQACCLPQYNARWPLGGVCCSRQPWCSTPIPPNPGALQPAIPAVPRSSEIAAGKPPRRACHATT